MIFILLLVGRRFVLAIYLSFTDATAGSLSGHWVGFDNFASEWHNPIFRHAVRNTIVMTLISQAMVVFCAAILSNYLAKPFRGRWFLRFLIILPWAAPVALGAITWLWIFDSLYSIVNWFLIHAPHLVAHLHLSTLRRPDRAAVARPPQPRDGVDHRRPGVARPPVRGRDLPRRPRVDPAGGRGRREGGRRDGDQEADLRHVAAAAADRARGAALRDRLHGDRHGGRLHHDERRAVQLDADADDVGVPAGIQGGSLGEGAAVSLFLLPVLALVAITMLAFARRAEVA